MEQIVFEEARKYQKIADYCHVTMNYAGMQSVRYKLDALIEVIILAGKEKEFEEFCKG